MSDDTRSFKIEQPGGVLRRIRCARSLPWASVRREIANVCKYANPIVRYKCDDATGSVIAIDCDAILERAFVSVRAGQALRVMVVDGAATETKTPPMSPSPSAGPNPIPRVTFPSPSSPVTVMTSVTESWNATPPRANPIPLVSSPPIPSGNNGISSSSSISSISSSIPSSASMPSISVATIVSSSSSTSISSASGIPSPSTSTMVTSMSGSAVIIGTDMKTSPTIAPSAVSSSSSSSSSTVASESKRSGPAELPTASPSLHDRSWMMASNRGEGVPSWSAYTGGNTTNDTFDPDSTNGDDAPDEGEAVLDDGSRSVQIAPPSIPHHHAAVHANGGSGSGSGISNGTSPASSTSASGILNNPATLLALAQSTMLAGSTSLEGSMIMQLASQLQTSFIDLAKIRDEIKADRESLLRERAEQQAALARERAQMATERAEVAAVVAALNSSQILQPLRARSPAVTRDHNGHHHSKRPSSAERRRQERQLRRSNGNGNVTGLPPRQSGSAPAPAPATVVVPVSSPAAAASQPVVTPITVTSASNLATPPFSPREPGASSPSSLLRQIQAHVTRGSNNAPNSNDLPVLTTRVLRTATADDSASGASSSTDVQTPHHSHHHHHRGHDQRSPAPIRRRGSSGSSSSNSRSSSNNNNVNNGAGAGLPVMSSVSRQSSVDSTSERGDESPQTDDTDNDDELMGEIEGDMGVSPSISASPSPMVRPIVLQSQPSPMITPSIGMMVAPVVTLAAAQRTTAVITPRVDLAASVSDDFVRLDTPAVDETKYASALARLRAAGHHNDSFNIDMLNENNGDVDAVLADYAKFFAPLASSSLSRAILPTPPPSA